MGQAGYILRFVDVVLILLFGFISISSIETTTIDPPESTEAPSLPPDQQRVLFVGIQPNGTFLVEEETQSLTSIPALRTYLVNQRSRYGGAALKVRLRASRVAPIRYLTQAAALCDELGLRKSIEVKINRS